MKIKNCRLKKVKFKNNDAEGLRFYGFILMAKGEMHEFYFKNDEKERDSWVDVLKPSVVLIDLKDDFDIFELLGRGNFAKVHKCSRKGVTDG